MRCWMSRRNGLTPWVNGGGTLARRSEGRKGRAGRGLYRGRQPGETGRWEAVLSSLVHFHMRCTLYSPVVDHQALESAKAMLPGWSLQLEGEPARWSTARFVSDQGVLEFNSLEFTAPQDAFSKIILGTSSYFWRRKDLSEAVREDLLQFV